MITIHECEQGSEEWFLLRCSSLGSSRAKDAMAGGQGKVRKTLAYQLAAESVTGIKSEIRTTPAMQHGIDIEPEARAYFELATGLVVQQVGLITNDDYPGQHCSPDGLIADDCCLEIKAPQPATHAKYLAENRLPPEYKAQVHHQMMISGRTNSYFVSYHPAFARQLILEVVYDSKYVDTLKSKLTVFMDELAAIKEKIR